MKYENVGDITLADAFYEMTELLKEAMDKRILSGKNIEKIDLKASMEIEGVGEVSASKLDYDFHIE